MGASISVELSLECDVLGHEGEPWEKAPGELLNDFTGWTKLGVWRQAHNAGWSRRKGIYRCPRCSEKARAFVDAKPITDAKEEKG